jgi:hypothetical protein
LDQAPIHEKAAALEVIGRNGNSLFCIGVIDIDGRRPYGVRPQQGYGDYDVEQPLEMSHHNPYTFTPVHSFSFSGLSSLRREGHAS